jgi:hemerythrin
MYNLAYEQLVKIEELPQDLRTGHWYNDLQHGMLVILLRRTMIAIRQGRMPLANRLLDSLTMYLYVHFLDEEEGMSDSLQRGLHHQEAITTHLNGHDWFLKAWDDQVLFPAKKDGNWNEAAEGLVSYYNSILAHIAEDDQETYGQASHMETTDRATEIASIATASLPLSPYMKGAYAVVAATAPETAALMDRTLLPPAALEPLTTRFHAPGVAARAPMLPGKRCVHDAVLRSCHRSLHVVGGRAPSLTLVSGLTGTARGLVQAA